MTRLGLLYPTNTPVSPKSWSGTPAGLASGFSELGVEVVPVGTTFGLGMRSMLSLGKRIDGQGGAVSERLSLMRKYRTKNLSISLRAKGQLDALLAMGTDLYDLGGVVTDGLPCFTYDDATLAQMWRHMHSDLRISGFSSRQVTRWANQQRDSSKHAALCFSSTAWAGRAVSADYGIDPSNVLAVGMGHQPKVKNTDDRDWEIPRFLFVGLDWERKNGAAVIAAFERVRECLPEATLDVVGVQRQIDVPGVTVHGVLARDDKHAQAKLASLYSRSTCFVLPSRFDPSPISYLEAASSGLPVIATNQGGASELLGEGAIVVDPSDVNQIKNAMILAADKSVAQRMSGAGRVGAEASTWVEVARRMLVAMNLQRNESESVEK